MRSKPFSHPRSEDFPATTLVLDFVIKVTYKKAAADCTDYTDGAHPRPLMRAIRVIRAIRGCLFIRNRIYE